MVTYVLICRQLSEMGLGVKLCLLIFSFLTKVSGEGLRLCSNSNVESIELCKKSNNYRPNVGPDKPTFYDVIIDLKNIIDVDQNKNTITAYVYIITQWNDSRLDYAQPDDNK